jgi:hypothetical protein
MTVKELIEHLQTLDEDLPVAYRKHSEFADLNSVALITLETLRDNGGYLTELYTREDRLKGGRTYVCFPGN